jgi:TPR repeat protein
LKRGDGVARNLGELSPDHGNADEQLNFGICLNNGEGVKYFKRSADQGSSQGQLRYAMSLSLGSRATPT